MPLDPSLIPYKYTIWVLKEVLKYLFISDDPGKLPVDKKCYCSLIYEELNSKTSYIHFYQNWVWTWTVLEYTFHAIIKICWKTTEFLLKMAPEYWVCFQNLLHTQEFGSKTSSVLNHCPHKAISQLYEGSVSCDIFHMTPNVSLPQCNINEDS